MTWRVEDLRKTLGVCVHLSSNVQPYATPSNLIDAAKFVGARFVRDGLTTDPWNLTNHWPQIYASGLKLLAIASVSNVLVVSDVIAAIKNFVAMGSDFVMALEGPNEPFQTAYTYNGVTNPTIAISGWPSVEPGFTNIADYCCDLHAALAADSMLGPLNLPLWSTTLAMLSSYPDTGLEFLTVQRDGCYKPIGTVLADVANLHAYVKNDASAVQSVDESGDHLIEQLSRNFGNTTAGYIGYQPLAALLAIPRVISEYGYSTATPSVGVNNKVTADIQGKDNLTAWLNAFTDGFQYFCLYELLDEDATGNEESTYGLFDSSIPANPKPCATYFHNFITIVNDAGINANDFPLNEVDFNFDGLPSTGRYLTLQSSDGGGFVVLWNNVNNWNLSNATPLTIAPVAVTVMPSIRTTLYAYDPTLGTEIQQTSHSNFITIPLADYPYIVRYTQHPTNNSLPRIVIYD